jgi:PAS domain S-box-containing protein
MVIKKSLTLYILGLIVFLILLTSLSYYFVEVSSQQEMLKIQETSKDKDIRFVIQSLVNNEVERLSSLSKSLRENEELIINIAISSSFDEDVGPIKEDMDKLSRDLRLDIFQVTDERGRIIYSTDEPEARGGVADYLDITGVLKGDDALVVSESRGGWAIRAVVPARVGRELVGTIMVGTRLDDDLAAGFARATDVELAFGSIDGIAASSLPPEGRDHLDTQTMLSSLAQKTLVHQHLPGTNKVVNYAPIRIADKVFALAVEFDVSEFKQLTDERNKRHLTIMTYIILASLGLGLVFTLYLVAPLKKLKSKAEKTVRELTGEEIETPGGDEIKSLVRSFNIMLDTVMAHIEERARAEDQLQSYILRLEQYTADLIKKDEALKDSEMRIKKAYQDTLDMLEKAPLGIFLVNSEGVVEYVNSEMLRISGSSIQEFMMTNVFTDKTYIELGLHEKIREAFGGKHFAIDAVECTSFRENETTIMKLIGVPFGEQSNNALVFVEDITELKKAEELIYQARQDWEDTFNTITDMITIHDEKFNIIRANAAAKEIFGMSASESKQVKCFKYIHGSDSPPDGCRSCACFKTGEPVVEEYYEPHLDRFLEIRAIPRLDDEGNVFNLIHIIRDITGRKQAESIANAVNVMNNIGYVFSGIRHELGNPINSIKTSVSVLNHNIEKYSTESAKVFLDRVLEELDRVEYLLKSLKSFNMYETSDLQDVRLRDFMDRFVLLVEKDFKNKGIIVNVSFSEGAEWAHVDPRALNQVMLNVVTNAADALEGISNPKVDISVKRSGISDMVSIKVLDNGCGMSEEQLENLFRPFYTSKARGTGLGLVIIKKMISNMKGFIDIKSRRNHGTEVEISIPEGEAGEG